MASVSRQCWQIQPVGRRWPLAVDACRASQILRHAPQLDKLHHTSAVVSAPKFALIYLKTNFDASMPSALRTPAAAHTPLAKEHSYICAVYKTIVIQILFAANLTAGSTPFCQQQCKVVAINAATVIQVR